MIENFDRKNVSPNETVDQNFDRKNVSQNESVDQNFDRKNGTMLMCRPRIRRPRIRRPRIRGRRIAVVPKKCIPEYNSRSKLIK
jgi:hypothetical protein